MPFIVFNGCKVYYKVAGKGQPVVLLHGFLEHSEMWKAIKSDLKKEYQVITVDLCGHGKSAVLKGEPSIKMMASAVYAVLQSLKINQYMLVGHSMGGYVSLELLNEFPNDVLGLCLYHSTALSDSKEKQENRDRAIKIVNENKESFISMTIPMLFSELNRKKCAKGVNIAIKQGLKTKKNGAIYCLKAMKNRPNHTGLVKNFSKRVFYVLGEQDSVLPKEMMYAELKLVSEYHRIVLKDVGHMSQIEKPVLALKTIKAISAKMALQF